MAIHITCSSCGMQGQVPDKVAGQNVKCKCGAFLEVPPAGGTAPTSAVRKTAARPKTGTHPSPSTAPPQPREPDQIWQDLVAPDKKRLARRKSRGAGAKIATAVVLIGILAGAGAGVLYRNKVLSWIGVEKQARTTESQLVAKGPAPAPATTSQAEVPNPKTIVEQPTPKVEKTNPIINPEPSPSPKLDKTKPIIIPQPPPLKVEKSEPKTTTDLATPPRVEKTEPKVPADPPSLKKEKPKPEPVPQPLPAQVIFKNASPAVVRVLAKGTRDYQGSGFFISPDGIVVTNHHMIKDASTASILTSDEERYKVEGIISMDVPADLVLLKVSGKGFPTLELGDAKLPVIGDRVYAIGNPQGLVNTPSDGLVSGLRQMDNDVMHIQTTAPISPGSSGGPLLSAQGKVIGITSATIVGGQNLNLAVPVARLAKLLEERGALRPLPGPNSAVSLRWHLKLGDAFYVDFTDSQVNRLRSKGIDWNPVETGHTMLSRLKVTEINQDGIVLEMRIDNFKMKTMKARAANLAKALDKLKGATFTVTLTRQHSVMSFDGLEELLKTLIDQAGIEAQLEFRQTLDQMLLETFNFGPAVGTAVNGDSWQYKTSYDWGSVGVFQITRFYACEGRTEEGTKIAIQEVYKYRLPKGKAAANNDLKITGGNIKVEESKGVLIFNPKARRLMRTEFNTRVVGQLEGIVRNEASTIDLVIETGTRIRVFDKLPEAAKPAQK
jgi:S1-C subfamily serine protease